MILLSVLPVSLCRPLTIILYLLFLLLVVIILLNVLIAQVSETYTAVQSTARASLLYNRSKYIVGCEEKIALWFLLWTCNFKRIRLFHHMWCDVESEVCMHALGSCTIMLSESQLLCSIKIPVGNCNSVF